MEAHVPVPLPADAGCTSLFCAPPSLAGHRCVLVEDGERRGTILKERKTTLTIVLDDGDLATVKRAAAELIEAPAPFDAEHHYLLAKDRCVLFAAPH